MRIFEALLRGFQAEVLAEPAGGGTKGCGDEE